MKVLFGLCLIAVVLSVGEGNRTYREWIVTENCSRDYCVIKDGYVCRCGRDGWKENADCSGVAFCLCTPGEYIHPAGLHCICPICGLLKPSDCVPEIRGSGAGRRASHSVNIFHRFTSSDKPHLPYSGH